MRKIISVLTLLLFISCSSDEVSFQFEAVVNTPKVVLDKPFTITVSMKEQIAGLKYSFDNFATHLATYTSGSYGTSQDLHFRFSTIGKKTIYIRLIKDGNIESETKVITVDVERGESVRITGLKINSFDGINTVWDPEHDKSNPNSLADVSFYFSKVGYYNAFSSNGTIEPFYQTSVKENQGNLTWSFLNENLYIDPQGYFIFNIFDQDGPNLVQTLANSVNVPHIYMSQYASTKPSSIIVNFPESNSVEFILYLEWP